jgi:outer membrane protein assembly factor BamE
MRNSTMTIETMRPTTNPSRRLLALCALMATLSLAGGCLYRMPIQQGNYLDPSQVIQLKEGMTRSQVSFLLGTPMVPNGFNTDRWDYYFYEKDRRMKEASVKRLTVWFKDEKVEKFERPADTEKAAAAMAAVSAVPPEPVATPAPAEKPQEKKAP